MTTLAHRLELRGPRNGGVAARRAVVRWAWRLFRREWRRQILVTALLTVAVAAAIGSVTIAYNSGAADDAKHGSASYLLRFDGTDQRTLGASLDSARDWFGTIDVIGHRSFAVPGDVETVEFRSQDPRGAFGSALLALRRGTYPVGPRQIAVTDGVADLLALQIGEALALDGRRRTVVGIVENPRDLSDEFALVSPGSAGALDNVTVLVDAGDGSIDAFRQSLDRGADGRSAFAGSEARPKNQSASALAMFSLATVFLLLASLVAAAGFAVIAQRRLRQLGMLAAIGATQKHLRLVLLTNGAVVGAIGAVIGTVLGLALWLVIIPTLETAFDHRIDALSLPWTLLAMVVLVAVLGATVAAWWPGRAVARVPVMLALSARPPRPKPAHRSAICSWVHWRSASSPGRPGTSPSLRAWRCETSPAIRPARGRHSPPSSSPSASQLPSSSARQPRRNGRPSGWPPRCPTCPTAKSGCTRAQPETRSSSSSRSKHPPSSHGALRASVNSPQLSMRQR